MPARELHEEDVPDWTLAKCGDVRDDDHFPDRGSAQVQAKHAKKVCKGEDSRPPCVLREQCLTYAIAINERFGVWGGMSERERYHEGKRREMQSAQDTRDWLSAERRWKRQERARIKAEEQERVERRARRAAASRKAWETRRRDAGTAKGSRRSTVA